MSAPTVTVLGLGEAGSMLAAGLVAAGVTVQGYDPVAPGPAGIARMPDPAAAVAGARIVLSVNTAAVAIDVAGAALSGIAPGAVFADMNTGSPELKRSLAALVGDAGVLFADVALLAPVPARGLRTPTLASGPGAAEFAATLEPLGMPVDVISVTPGDAAALKLLRSVFMKGLAATALESLAAAEAAGQREWLERQLGDVIGSALLERLVEGSRRHAARRIDELDAATDLLESLGVEPRIARASRAILAELHGDLE